MRLFILSLALAIPFGFAGACSSNDTSCDGPGDCPAGSICTGGVCEAVPTPGLDVGSRNDANTGVYDAGPVIDTGRPPRRDAGPPPPVDASTLGPDGGSSMPPFDGGPAPDIPPPLLDVPIVNVLTLGDPCTVPDLGQGEVDACSIDNPNFYCLASLDGQSAYCSASCAIINDPDEEEGDAGLPNVCGAGCCLPAVPGQDAGAPGMPIDGVCRFAQDCN